ncbi:formimidoylglutamase [Aestuariibaculum sediminum]|uniref:Formimidoylglutamase n=1 Tax=Aestuariibaculum sediminum TaxID=2770637 RepID=A0A8J6Q9F5_9FLAO|nr:formimidoylglutamase [Aestuariibaculum sediminum]MBD0833570.1 formimidoylglutamase [Aestuariibaculum sediminum]
MDKLTLFDKNSLNKLLNKRSGESKFGQDVKYLTSISNIYEQLKSLDVKYVIIGLPEDVGVFANHGKTGTSKTWEIALKTLLNIQSNEFTSADKVLILGHLNFSEELKQLDKLIPTKTKHIVAARNLVKDIDKHVVFLVNQIVLAGKTPIIIGGGHNNAYGNLKGTSLALKKPVNAINLDAHSDFRAEEGRHSGNGFSYAFNEGFLNNYFVFGLQRNYTSKNLFKSLNKLDTVQYITFEDLEVLQKIKFSTAMKQGLEFVSHSAFGIEIDCDTIENVPSSAMTPSGFSVNKARRFVSYFGKHKNAAYLHICEAAPTSKSATQVGKLIAFLITDFIYAQNHLK